MSLQLISGSITNHYTTFSKAEKTLEDCRNPINILIHYYQKQNKDFRIIIGGDNGNGKSAFMCKIGEMQNPITFVQNPQFAVDHQIHFFAKDWLQGVQDLKPYDLNAMDEPVQSGGNHREFMSETNMVLTKTVATARFKKLVIPVCIPFIDQLDLDLIKLCQIYCYCFAQGRAEVFRISNPKFGGDPWFEKIIDELRWNMPNQKLWNLYSKKKQESEDGQYQKYQEKLHRRTQEDRGDNTVYKSLLEKIVANPRLFNERTHKLSIPGIMNAEGIGRDKADKMRARYEAEHPVDIV